MKPNPEVLALARDVAADSWTIHVTPPLPLAWPPGPLVWYAYGRRRRAGLVDGEEISVPLARIAERRGLFGGRKLHLERLARPALLDTEGVRPLTDGELALLAEVDRAGPLEELLAAAAGDPAKALLVRRRYCFWKGIHRIAREVLPLHPAFVAFLDCGAVQAVVEPRLPAHPDPLLRPEFDRRWPRGPARVWQLGITPAFPEAWPATPRTQLVHYAFALRVEQAQPVPKPREVTAPWGRVVRDGVDGPLAFTALAELPASLGVQPGRAPPPGWYDLVGEMGKNPGETLVRAATDDAVAATVRAYYREWTVDEALLAPWVLARHEAFANFLA